MNDKEIAEKLELAYGVFIREGASSRYMNINNHLIESEKQSVQTTLNLALHYLYIDDMYFFKKAYHYLSNDFKFKLFNDLNTNGELNKIGCASQVIIEGLCIKDYITALIQLTSHGNYELTVKCIKKDNVTQFQLQNNAEALQAIANSYLNLERDEDAVIYLKTLLTLDPQDLISRYNLAITYENIGEFEEAKSLFYLNIKDYNHIPSLARLLSIENKNNLHMLLETCEKIINTEEQTKDNLTDLYFSMGTAFDKLANYAHAYKYFKLANDSISINSVTDDPIYLMNEQNKIEYQLNNDFSPIFICGMFRSGSTLLEQVISMHSQFESGGEIEFFTAETLASCIENIDYASELARAYEKKMSLFKGGINRVINKLPDNVLYIGLIKSLFPNAKFIITSRNIKDTCLSIYFQNIADSYAYASDLELTKAYYIKQKAVAKRWLSKFNDNVIIFNYEDLIADTEPSLKKLCHFLGVEFEKEMLNFYKNSNSVRTASYHQVRSKLHAGSVGRFKNYQHYLKGIF